MAICATQDMVNHLCRRTCKLVGLLGEVLRLSASLDLKIVNERIRWSRMYVCVVPHK